MNNKRISSQNQKLLIIYLTPMSSKMFMSFFLQSKMHKTFEENIPGFLSIVDFSGTQQAEGPNSTFSAVSKGSAQSQPSFKGLI